MMLMALSMAPLHLRGEYNQNCVKHDFLGHVMALASTLVSHNASSVKKVSLYSLGQDD